MSKDTENRGKEIFEQTQQKQAKLVKKIMLFTFVGMGFVFAIIGTVFLIISGEIYGEIGIVFLPLGVGCIALGIILFLALPKKYNYDKYKARVEKYGYMDIYSMQAKLAELEARVEELENNNKD